MLVAEAMGAEIWVSCELWWWALQRLDSSRQARYSCCPAIGTPLFESAGSLGCQVGCWGRGLEWCPFSL